MKLTGDKLGEMVQNGTMDMPSLAEGAVQAAQEVETLDRSKVAELADQLGIQPLANAEMQMEDDYNMIDGIINNGSKEDTTKLIESFAHNLNRLEAALYNIDGRIERTQDNLAKLRLDHAEAQKIVAEPFPQQEELDTKEQRLKVVTDELNQAAIEAKKNAPKREKTCYFERAKMKRDAARLGKKPKTPKDQTKGRSKKQGIE